MRRFPKLSAALWSVTSLGIAAMLFLPQSDAKVEAAPTASLLVEPAVSPAPLPAYRAPLPKLAAADLDARKLGPAPKSARAPWLTLQDSSPETAIVAHAAVPEAATPTPRTQVWVGAKSVNVRAAPSVTSQKLDTLRARDPVFVPGREGSWASVVLPSGEVGWVAAAFLTADPKVTNPSPRSSTKQEKQQTMVESARLGSDAILRTSPNRSAARVSIVSAGDVVTVVERRKGWALVILPDGADGWVRVR